MAAVAGCGGSDSTADTAAPLGKAEFIKQANADCTRARAGLAGREAEFERRRGRHLAPGADMVHFVYLPTIEGQLRLLESLPSPPGEETRVETMLKTEHYALDSVAVMRHVWSQAAAERYFAKADRLLRAYGLDSCANHPGSGLTGG